MKVYEVAELIGTTAATIRAGLQQGVFPFGVAFKSNPKNKNYVYIIYEEKVKEYLKGKEK